MAGTGSLIKLHHHDNIDILNDFTAKDDVLYFRGERVCEDYEKLSIKIMIDDVWDAMQELEESAGGVSDDDEQSEGSFDNE